LSGQRGGVTSSLPGTAAGQKAFIFKDYSRFDAQYPNM
jgi:hypothetical protein